MDDSDDEEETMQVDKPKSSVASELENYLDCRDVVADPLKFWRNYRQASPVYLKSLSRRFLHREARQALSEFLTWLVIV